MIQGYPAKPSVSPGEPLRLHVATDARRFRVCVYRWGDGFLPMGASAWWPGASAPAKGADEDWGWPDYTLPIPRDWPSGVYIAQFEEQGQGPRAPSFAGRAALFVVRGRAHARLLYKVPLATYHAYNCTGGGCFYVNPPRSHRPPGSKVSLRRPGGGIGGETWGALDHYDPASPRQTFAHWDAPFIRWLSHNGYAADFCTDLDLHADAGVPEAYRLLLNVGHDEYWTESLRDAVETYIQGGGNAAFFGANLCWWRIHVVDGGAGIVCHQGGPRGALDHWWSPTGANRPENALTGVSYRHGGGWWDGPRQSAGYFVQRPNHWVFAGTGLRAGQAFGVDTCPPLVGYECDGVPLAHFDANSGLATLDAMAARCGTPSAFRLLAAGPLEGPWQERPPDERDPRGEALHAAAMGVYSRNGTVFTAGTTDWAQVLATGDRHVDRITRNVIDRLLRTPRPRRMRRYGATLSVGPHTSP